MPRFGRPREPTPLYDSYAESRGGSPLTSIDGSDDSEGEAPPPLPKRRQIPKPPGEAGRRNCGGFNLESALNWEGNKYKRMMVNLLFTRMTKPANSSLLKNHIDDMIKKRLDTKKSFTRQDQGLLIDLIKQVYHIVENVDAFC